MTTFAREWAARPVRAIPGLAGTDRTALPSAVAPLGEQTRYTGHARSAPFRWFTDPAARERYHPADHDRTSRINVAQLRAAVTRDGPGSTSTASS